MNSRGEDFHIEEYESRLEPARRDFQARLSPLFAERRTPSLALFLIHFCSQGVGMTEPVPGWIRRAGERTKALGYPDLGDALLRHAAHEAGHHEMMIADTRLLVGWWNERFSPELVAESFLAQAYTPGVESYRALHEQSIASETPFCQIAIEYEIEKVSIDCGPLLFGYIAESAGHEILKCLSFVTEHVAVDASHTKYNRRALSKFLALEPSAMDCLVRAGSAALDCYARYIEDDFDLAKRLAAPAVRIDRESSILSEPTF